MPNKLLQFVVVASSYEHVRLQARYGAANYLQTLLQLWNKHLESMDWIKILLLTQLLLLLLLLLY